MSVYIYIYAPILQCDILDSCKLDTVWIRRLLPSHPPLQKVKPGGHDKCKCKKRLTSSVAKMQDFQFVGAQTMSIWNSLKQSAQLAPHMLSMSKPSLRDLHASDVNGVFQWTVSPDSEAVNSSRAESWRNANGKLLEAVSMALRDLLPVIYWYTPLYSVFRCVYYIYLWRATQEEVRNEEYPHICMPRLFSPTHRRCIWSVSMEPLTRT